MGLCCYNKCNNVMVELKVTQVGNSLGIILPKDILSKLGVSKGSKITLVEQPKGFYLSSFDPEFSKAIEAAQEGMARYKNALSELAK